eukprot:gene37232-45940_t
MTVFCDEYRRTNTLNEFKHSVNPRKCWVVREGRTREICSSEVVVGDLVVLYPGSKVPADMRLASSLGMKVNKSVLTGDSQSVKVSAEAPNDALSVLEANNTVFMGTTLVEGSGTGIVIATGKTTQIGRIMHQSNIKPKHVVLQTEFARTTAVVSLISVVLVIALILYWAFYYRFKLLRKWRLSLLLINIVALLTSVVPIGMSIVTTVGLAIIARRLRTEHHVLSKHMGGTVTLGAATMLLIDKTGILTQNIITVTRMISCADLSLGESKTEGRETSETVSIDDGLLNAPPSPRILKASCHIAVMCNNEQLLNLNELQTEIIRRALQTGQLQVSVPAEVNKHSLAYGLLNWVDKQSNVATIYSTYHVHAALRDKASATVVVTNVISRETFVFVSGHIERILPLCVSYLDENGNEMNLSPSARAQMTEAMNAEARACRNLLVLAQIGPLDRNHFPADFEYRTEPQPNFPITNLTLVSCLALSDPTREGVRETMQQVRTAGISVVVLTGDSEDTALSTARSVGLVTGAVHTLDSLHCRLGAALHAPNETIIVNGNFVPRMTPVEWQYVFAHHTVIFARTQAEQKELIVERYQERGHIVAVTGDGINDCPAMQRADVGIAVSSATEVVRGVSDIVLFDGDVEGVVHGVRAGRLKYTNLRKAIAFLLSGGCWPVILSTGAFFLLGIPQPILILHETVIGCTVDVFCGVALMCEPPERDIMAKPPRSMRHIRLIDFSLLAYSYMFYGNLVALGCFINYFMYMSSRGSISALRGITIPAEFESDKLPLGYRLDQLLFAWKFGADIHSPYGQDQLNAWIEASNVYFLTIVMAQLGQVLSVRHSKPYFYHTVMNHGRLWDECRIQWPIVYAWMTSLITV